MSSTPMTHREALAMATLDSWCCPGPDGWKVRLRDAETFLMYTAHECAVHDDAVKRVVAWRKRRVAELMADTLVAMNKRVAETGHLHRPHSDHERDYQQQMGRPETHDQVRDRLHL